MEFDFNPQETVVIQKLWGSLNFYNNTIGNIKINEVKFKFQIIDSFKQRLLVNFESFKDDLHGEYLNNEVEYLNDIDIITYQFDQLIQLMSIIVLNLDSPIYYKEVLLKFAKINHRIYNLNLVFFCQLLFITILKILQEKHTSNVNELELILIKFFNKFNTLINDLTIDPVLEESDRLSIINSDVSTLSLNNDQNSILSDQSPLSKNYFKPNSFHDDLNDNINSNAIDNISIDGFSMIDTTKEIDIDDVHDLEDAFSGLTTLNYPHGISDDNKCDSTHHTQLLSVQDEIVEVDDDDSTFDYLNSFNASEYPPSTKQPKPKKSFSFGRKAKVEDGALEPTLTRRLSKVSSRASIMLSPSAAKNIRRLSSVNITTEKHDLTRTRSLVKRKDECIIM